MRIIFIILIIAVIAIEKNNCYGQTDENPPIQVNVIRWEGAAQADSVFIGSCLIGLSEASVASEDIETGIDCILRFYENKGFPLAEISVFTEENPAAGIDFIFSIFLGQAVVFDSITWTSEINFNADMLAKISSIRSNTAYNQADVDDLPAALMETGLFESVEEPKVQIDRMGKAKIVLNAKTRAPGIFDFVLGYQPAANNNEKGNLVGNGRLLLRNVFGAGRRLSFQLARNPGLVSEVSAGVSVPWILGTSFSGDLNFAGFQQDSTYGTQDFGAVLGYRIERRFKITVSIQRRLVRPGVSDDISRASSWFAGIGFIASQKDHPILTRKGWSIDLTLSQGRKTSESDAVTAGQKLLLSEINIWQPTFSRQFLHMKSNMQFLISEKYDLADLFRAGGANSLRGYDEDAFFAHQVLIGQLSYHYQLDMVSSAFVFIDGGWIRRPAISINKTLLSATTEIKVGYGVGLRYQTPVGLVNASYALNPETGFSAGRVHLGLIVGL